MGPNYSRAEKKIDAECGLEEKKVGDTINFVSFTPLHLGTCLQAHIKKKN